MILTEWEEFANLDLLRLDQELKYPIIIDGRNLYDPEIMAEHGFSYYSVGRGPLILTECPQGRCATARLAHKSGQFGALLSRNDAPNFFLDTF